MFDLGERVDEDGLNRRVRRVDWRFALPSDVVVESVAGDCSADLEKAVAEVYGALARLDDAEPSSVDLVVLTDPDDGRLAAAERVLRDGGVLYVELTRLAPRGPARARRRLRRVSLVPTACLWTWPPVTRATPHVWLPPDDREVVRFYLRSRPPERRAAFRVFHALRDRAWLLAARVGLLAPLSLLAAKTSTPTRSEARRWLLLTGGRSVTNKVVAFPFAPGSSEPDLVVKTGRVPEVDDRLTTAARCLSAIRTAQPALEGIPGVVFVDRRSGRVSVGETLLGSSPVATVVDDATYEACVDRSVDWLIRFADGRAARVQDAWRGLILEPALACLRQAPPSLASPELVAACESSLRSLPSLPRVPEHRDFAPWNVGVARDGTIAVLDWESAVLDGLPLLDLEYMLAWLSIVHDGALESGRVEDSYRRAFDPTSDRGRVAAAAEMRYTQALGIDASAVVPLRLLTWLTHLEVEIRRARENRGEEAARADLARSIHLRLWREEMRLRWPT